MRFVIMMAFVATSITARADSFRYREFVSKSADCNAEVTLLKTRFEQATGLKVQAVQCAPVVVENPGDVPVFEGAAATLVYTAARAITVNSVVFGHGDSYGTGGVSLAGNIGGAYASQADCEADLAAQTDLFKAQTGGAVLAAYCVPPSQGLGAFGLQIDSLSHLARHLYVYEAFDDEVADANWARAQQLVTSQGVRVARASENAIYFYDSGTSDRPVHMQVRTARAGLFNSSAECSSQAPVLASLLKTAGVQNFDVSCVGSYSSSSLVVVGASSDHLYFDATPQGEYASLAECKADEPRASNEARRKRARGFIGAYCVFSDPMDALHAYGIETVYSN